MIRFPNCKINIGLYITGKRKDGYHDLETVFHPLPLHDILEAVPAQKEAATMSLYGKPIAGSEKDNLVWRAYELLKTAYPDKIPALDIHLYKHLPMGAGLGGGSADGSFMLMLLNDMYKLGLPQEKLAALALQLGSDCPFFIYNKPCFATGRGEQLSVIDLNLSGYSIQLICPRVHVSTKQAFQQITPRKAPVDLEELAKIPVADWKDAISNDFEKPVFAQHPVLSEIKEQLYHQGAHYASMSGSGSTLYGIFQKGHKANLKIDTDFDGFYLE